MLSTEQHRRTLLPLDGRPEKDGETPSGTTSKFLEIPTKAMGPSYKRSVFSLWVG